MSKRHRTRSNRGEKTCTQAIYKQALVYTAKHTSHLEEKTMVFNFLANTQQAMAAVACIRTTSSVPYRQLFKQPSLLGIVLRTNFTSPNDTKRCDPQMEQDRDKTRASWQLRHSRLDHIIIAIGRAHRSLQGKDVG
jgi:hypothetical protein